jgi:hypothetical protein
VRSTLRSWGCQRPRLSNLAPCLRPSMPSVSWRHTCAPRNP